MVQSAVYVQGAKATMDALKQFDPEAEKAIRKRINKAARTMVLAARRSMPSGRALPKWGNWIQNGRDLSYNGNNQKIRSTRANMRRRGQAFSNYIGIVNPTPAGAIFELAGRRNSVDQGFHEALLNRGYGISKKQDTQRGGVFKAFNEVDESILDDIVEAIDDAEKIVRAHLRQVGGI